MVVMLDVWVLVLIAVVLIAVAISALIALMQVVSLRVRYERFRMETAAMFTDTHATMQDINVRLTSAGYPPGRIVPRDPLVQPARTAPFMPAMPPDTYDTSRPGR